MSLSNDNRHRTQRLLWAGIGVAALAVVLLGLSALYWRWSDAPQAVLAPAPLPAPAPQPATSPAPSPVGEATLAQILTGRQNVTAYYRLSENPRIHVIDFPDLEEQGRMMNRIAALIEKSGAPRDRVLSDSELAAYIQTAGGNSATFYFAHDYAAPSLARFYSMADSEGESLNRQETDLLSFLLDVRLLRRADAGYVADDPEMALISIVQPQDGSPPIDATLRETMLRHEVSHGEFFTNPSYREHCEEFWRERLTESERSMFRDFLAGSDYDPTNETLMINEAQAYLMHTPDRRLFSAARLGVSEDELVDLQRRFMTPQPPTPLLGGKRPDSN